MKLLALILTACSAFGACSSIDLDVKPRLIEATIVIDPAAPEELALLKWTVEFDAEAARNVQLSHVALIGDYAGEPLDLKLALSFPDDFNGLVQPGDEPTLELVNQGTTNGYLAFLCDSVERELAAFLQIALTVESDGSKYTPFSTINYSVDCLQGT